MIWLLIGGAVIAIVVLGSSQASAMGIVNKPAGGSIPQPSGGGIPAVPPSSVIGCGITSDPASWPSGDRIWDVCRAVAMAEGANVTGAAPDHYNNPGDLSAGDEHGQSISGFTTLPDGENLIVFTSKAGGWQALYSKFAAIVNRQSSVYSPDDSWFQIGAKYAGNARTWAVNVADALDVDPGTTLADYVHGSCMASACMGAGNSCLYQVGGCGSCG